MAGLSEHGRFDSLVIKYDGKYSNRLFAGTVTSRKKFRTPLEFREALYIFLSNIGYKYAIQGISEFHESEGKQDKVHAHVVLFCGNPPKGNKKNPFTFHVHPISSLEGWKWYMNKNTERTLEMAMAVYSGYYDYIISKRDEGYCLFGD